MIERFYTTQFVVRRIVWTYDGDNNPQGNDAVVTSFKGHIQQADQGLIEDQGLSLTNAFAVWCPLYTDVKPGDTLVVDDEEKYTVQALQRYTTGCNDHLQLLVKLDDIPYEGS